LNLIPSLSCKDCGGIEGFIVSYSSAIQGCCVEYVVNASRS